MYGERVLTVLGNKATRAITEFVRYADAGYNAAVAVVAAGIGGGGSYIKTDVGVKTLAVGTAGAKKVLLVCTVTEAFANGNGGQTTVKIGEVGSDASLAATSVFAGAILGKVFVLTGNLTAATNLIATIAAATGTGTGGLTITAFILPATI
jgi:hypothetical protein